MVKLIVFRVLFTITAYYNLDINQIVIKMTFSYSLIDQLIYIQIFKSLEDLTNKGEVCKLLKVLYKLKQALGL